ncbi:MAG: HAD family hydrolase [Firmicutes bacterium]|nr:HAD family hydrolase [Bacillota bacterium]
MFLSFKESFMRNAIIFDLDGTLWDATGSSSAIWTKVIHKYGNLDYHMTPEIAASLMGKTMEEIGEILFPNFSEKERMVVCEDFGKVEVEYLHEHGAILYDGLEETLIELNKNYDLFIVSNCQDGYIPAFLHSHKLEKYFKDIEMEGRTHLSKADNISLIMKRNHIEKAVYVGDTAGDEKSTRQAGIPFIFAKYGFGQSIAPDAIIEDIKELPKCMKNMEEKI